LETEAFEIENEGLDGKLMNCRGCSNGGWAQGLENLIQRKSRC